MFYHFPPESSARVGDWSRDAERQVDWTATFYTLACYPPAFLHLHTHLVLYLLIDWFNHTPKMLHLPVVSMGCPSLVPRCGGETREWGYVCPTWHTWGRCWRNKEGGFAVRIFPKGWVLSWPWDCPTPFQIAYTVYCWMSLSHSVCSREIWGICKWYVGGWVHRIVPRVWGLFPLGHVNSPYSISYQAPGTGGRAYHW